MIRLSEVDPERGGLEDLIVWGLTPIKRLLDLQAAEIDGLAPGEAENLSFFTDEIGGKVADLEDAILRFERHMMGLRRAAGDEADPAPPKPAWPRKRAS